MRKCTGVWCSQGPGDCVPCRFKPAREEDTYLCCNTVVRKGLACAWNARHLALCWCNSQVPETRQPTLQGRPMPLAWLQADWRQTREVPLMALTCGRVSDAEEMRCGCGVRLGRLSAPLDVSQHV